MNATATLARRSFPREVPQGPPKECFRQRFQSSLRVCMTRGFSPEESFGMVWVETLEEVPITEHDQAEIYGELIQWAKNALRS